MKPITSPSKFDVEFKAAVTNYLINNDESAFTKVYDLGRSSMVYGVGLLKILELCFQSLIDCIRESNDTESAAAMAAKIMDFCGESLTPFEMAYQNYKKAVDKLSSLNAQMNLILQSAGEGIFGVDHEGKVTFINDAAARLLGWEQTALIDTMSHHLFDSSETLSGADRPPMADPIRQTLTSGNVQCCVKANFYTRDGREFPVEVTVSPIQDRDEVSGAVVIFRDISERLHIERQLRQAKDIAESANRFKDEFLAVMSHEIRTPLNGIVGMSSLLDNEELTGQQATFIRTIRNSCDSLMTIINDILDFSKIESGKLVLENQSFSIRECIEDCLDLLALTAEPKGIDLAYIFETPIPEIIIGDSTRVRQVFLNLINNAIKFTENGEITVSFNHQTRSDGRIELAIAVRDTGIGIPQDKLNAIFDAFSQADSSTTRKYGGTGLGLAIARKISELMGGGLGVESVVGKGSVFRLRIVAEVANEMRYRHLQAEHTELRDRVLLSVIGNAVNRQIVRLHAGTWGMKVREMNSADEALQWLAAGEHFDIALIDHQTPTLDSMTLVKAIRQRQDRKNIPVVLLLPMSADMPNGDTDTAMIAAVIRKPMKPANIYKTLSSFFGGKPIAASQNPSSTRIENRTAERYPLRILIADDSKVNQQVAFHTLSRMGYTPDIVGDGCEVLSALEHRDYDVILMDLHMPTLDGPEATKRIMQELPSERRPIVYALTAAVLAEDRARCRDAGMAGIINKPFKISEIYQMIRSISSEQSAVTVPPLTVNDNGHDIDQSERQDTKESVLGHLQKILGGDDDREIIHQLIDVYLEETPAILDNLRSAIEHPDFAQIRAVAHLLKGRGQQMGLTAISRVAARLEILGKANNATGLGERFAELQAEIERNQKILQEIRAEQPVNPV